MTELLAQEAVTVSAVLKQLAHPARLKVLCCLLQGPKTVNELVDYSNSSQSWVSQFLSRMRSDGLVQAQKKGTYVHYRISDPRIRILMQAIYKTYCASGAHKRSKS